MSTSSPLPPPPQPTAWRLAPPIWTHDETLALLEAYRAQLVALGRPNLRSSDWPLLAADIRRLSAGFPDSSPKTPTQCRCKIEKLRKRFRNEQSKPYQQWPYFHLLASIDAIFNAPNHDHPTPDAAANGLSDPSNFKAFANGQNDRLNFETVTNSQHGSRFFGAVTNDRGDRPRLGALMSSGGLGFAVPRGTRSKMISRAGRNARISGWVGPRKEKKRKVRNDVFGDLVKVVMGFGDLYARIEERKMEMEREIEKMRMEMELKRTEIILESQRKIVDAFVKGGLGMKRTKVSTED